MMFVVNLVVNNPINDPNAAYSSVVKSQAVELASRGRLTLPHMEKMTVTLMSDGKWVTGLYMTHTRVSPCRVMGQSGMRCQLSASDLTAS